MKAVSVLLAFGLIAQLSPIYASLWLEKNLLIYCGLVRILVAGFPKCL